MTIEELLGFYLNLNIVLAVAAIVWLMARAALNRTALHDRYLVQLRLAYGVLLSVAFCPLILLGFDLLAQWGVLGRGTVPNVSDFVVAQFLDGNIAMAPTRFENLLMLRSELTHDVAHLSTWMGQTIALALAGATLVFVTRLIRSIRGVSGTIARAFVMRRIGRVDIRLTPETSVPFSTRGLFRHYIILPTSMLTQSNDMRIAITHELQHMRQGDLIWEILLEFARPLFFWNPAFGFWKREVEKLRELACDQQVLRNDRLTVREYCDCLLRVCRESVAQTRQAQLLTPSVPFAQLDNSRKGSASASFLRRRVTAMVTPTSGEGHGMLGVTFALALSASVVGGALFSQPANDWTQDRLMLSTIVNLERLDMRNGVQN